MNRLVTRAALVLSLLPAVALAEPVTVVTHSSGVAYINPSALDGLQRTNPPNADESPYELTLSSTFDWSGPLPARGEWASQPDSQVVIDFTLGDLAYHYAGEGSSSAILSTQFGSDGDRYQHEIWLDPPGPGYGYALKFEQVLVGPSDSFGTGGALTRGVTAWTGTGSNFSFTAYRSNDEYTLAFPMGGDATAFSVRVTSPVPEPAAYALLAAGLLTLGLRRRRNSAAS